MRALQVLSLITCILFSRPLLSQTKNYEEHWKKVDELIEKKNLPKSALAEVKKIYALATKDKNDVQVIKSLVYMIDLQDETREANEKESIRDIEKELVSAKEPALSVLKSQQANLYWQYFQNHRYNLYDRTNTVNFNKSDIATWTATDFHKKITELFLGSIKESQRLKQTSLEAFDPIIKKGNLRRLRPTLFDLLAHKALEYFKNDEHDIQKPAYAFEISREEAFAPANQFVKYNFTTKDSLSLQQKALLVYQELTSFHLNDVKPDALIDLEIERIEFVHDNAVMENKDELYKSALENYITTYSPNPVAAQASFLLASFYNNLASLYNPNKDTAHRYDRIKAKEILEKVVKDSSVKTEGWVNSYNLLKELTKKLFFFTVEKINIPNQPFRALINYTNIAVLNLRLIKATGALKQQSEEGGDDKFWDALIKATPIRSWKQPLPVTNDYQQHSAEIKVDGLQPGEYFLLAAEDKFQKKDCPLSQQLFYVSNISFIHSQEDFFVLNRETGLPLSNALVQVWEQYYDRKTSSYQKKKTLQLRSDVNGYFKFIDKKTAGTRYTSYYFDIIYNNDRLFLNDELIEYDVISQMKTDTLTEEQFEKRNLYTYLFTDRSIYRPGQVIYFKGISITKTRNNKNKIQPNYKNTIYLRNVNYQVVDSMNITTNDYGAFSGKFQLPSNTLNGRFTLYMKDYKGQQPVQVEEYKRPKFYVEFEKIKTAYKVNDTVQFTGSAKAYAGNEIDDARVSYRVVRQARFIYDWLRWWQPETESMEIINGILTTDSAGKFSIRFPAIPDRTISKLAEPVFDYHVYVNVTDINGETRSNETIVTAGYKSLLLKTQLDEQIPVDSFKTISVRTENLNGEYQPSIVNVSVFKLVPEQRLIRNRLWERPDQYVMPKEEFISYFPHDEYASETDLKTWQREKQVYARTDSTQVTGEWLMTNAQLPAGYYAIEIVSKGKDGQEVKDIRYIELFEPKSNQLNRPEYFWTKGSDESIEPGEKTTIQAGSSASIFLIKRKDHPSLKPVTAYSFEAINNEKKTFELSATEADRGGYGVNYFFVRDNRLYSFNDIIKVPWSNKELSIEYATFRDKTLPGSEEKWKVKITGYKNEKTAAEMLAGMYDASLDQFYYHQWIKPGIWTNYNDAIYWNAENFSQIVSNQKWIDEYHEEYVDWEYDQLGFDMYDLIAENNSITYRKYYEKVQEAKIGIVNQAGIRDKMMSAPPPPRITMAKFTPPIIRRDEFVRNAGYANFSLAVDSVAFPGRPGESDSRELKQNGEGGKEEIILPRKNFNETAFFFPDLKTDENGTIEFSFTAPEALTKWKLQTLAHTKELAFGFSKKELITQKQLMVQPNMPRFLRQGDRIELVAKIVNLSDGELKGQAQLQLFDATTNQPVDGSFSNEVSSKDFAITPGQSGIVKFAIAIPVQFNQALTWRITARSGSFSDAEENTLPVLSNKVLVTETLALPMRGMGTKNFMFEKLLQAGNSSTLQHQSLTVEYTSNPAWYAIQALPYLMEFPYECAEQTWNRYYANSLASKIANSSPRIKQIFEQWRTMDTAALLSNLQKNQELKSALLEETPWVLDAKSEEQQKKNIALLFDLVKMADELKGNMNKLKDLLHPDGSFPWFKGGHDDRYITQYILTGIGHLKKLNAIVVKQEDDISLTVNRGLNYLDKKIKQDYDDLIKRKVDLSKEQIGSMQVQYLYMRSFFQKAIPPASQTAFNFYKKQAQLYWKNQTKQLQAMIALALFRSNDLTMAKNILNSLEETSINNDETGMYWKENQFGYSWYWSYAPIETQSLMIEAFNEISKDSKTVDDLKTWLIKNKQTTNWKTTRATADACYAMLLQATDWLSNEPSVEIKLGTTIINNHDRQKEAGTGYFKQTVGSENIEPGMGSISVTVQPQGTNIPQTIHASWGSVYWQYFEDMDKVTTASAPLQLTKKIFIEKNSDLGPILNPVEQGMGLHVGDKIKVRIELRVDRDMDYVHMKDMRASALEPVNVLSGYKWQGELGYYETTKDASTNFFIDHLRKGTYVFEYPLFVTHTGNFSNGITTIQCMYAPEFNAHSEGVRITVD